MMRVDSGDVIEVKLVGRVKGGDVFESSEKPAVIIAGKGKLIPGLDRAIVGMEEGEKKTVEIQPSDGYGERIPELVRLVPLSAFKNSGIKPAPGMVVNIDGYPARVLSVSGGRVRVDFNHELAGKTLVFDVEVTKVYKSPEEKVNALVKKWFEKGIEAKIGDKVEILAKEEAYLARDYLDRKVKLLTELLSLEKPVRWTEEYLPDKQNQGGKA